MHAFIKFGQFRYVFVCDLVTIIKVCQCDIYSVYDNQTSKLLKITSRPSNHCWSSSMRRFKCVEHCIKIMEFHILAFELIAQQVRVV